MLVAVKRQSDEKLLHLCLSILSTECTFIAWTFATQQYMGVRGEGGGHGTNCDMLREVANSLQIKGYHKLMHQQEYTYGPLWGGVDIMQATKCCIHLFIAFTVNLQSK